MNVLDYIKRIRRVTQELNSKAVSDEDIISGLNEGLSDILEIIGRRNEGEFLSVLGKETYINMETGVQDYSIPQDCLGRKILHIQYKVGTDWYRLDPVSIYDEPYYTNLSPSNTLEGYRIISNKIKVFPKPSYSIVKGFKIIYAEELPPLALPIGLVDKVIDGGKIYLSNFNLYDSDSVKRLESDDVISVINSLTGDVSYNFRVLNIDESDEYLEIYSGISSASLVLSGINTNFRYFTFGSSVLSNVKYGDILTVTGSTGNDGDYTIIGVDSTSGRVYVREVIKDTTVDGSFSINLPKDSDGDYTYKGFKISETARDINFEDSVTLFGNSTHIKLPSIFQDYVVQYAVLECLKLVKEPIDEAMIKLQRLAKSVEDFQADKVATKTFRVRGY